MTPQGVVDVVGNFPFLGPDFDLPGWSKNFARQKLHVDQDLFERVDVSRFLDMMDEAGVAHVLLIAVKAGSASHRVGFQVPAASVAAVVEQHPDRFSGVLGVDPTMGMAGVENWTTPSARWVSSEPMISVAYKHPNVYIATDAYTPRHWPAALVHYINTWGSQKVLFGTDYPVLTFDRALGEIADLGLAEESSRLFLRDNAVRVYSLSRLTLDPE